MSNSQEKGKKGGGKTKHQLAGAKVTISRTKQPSDVAINARKFRFVFGVDDDQCIEIGEITIISSFLDHALDELLSSLLNIRRQQARCISRQVRSIYGKLNLIADLVDELPADISHDLRDHWQGTHQAIRSATEARNDVTHGIWDHDNSTRQWSTYRFSKKAGKPSSRRPVNHADLVQVRKSLSAASTLLWQAIELAYKLRHASQSDAPPPSPEKPR
jgi:hypothetical protein